MGRVVVTKDRPFRVRAGPADDLEQIGCRHDPGELSVLRDDDRMDVVAAHEVRRAADQFE